MFKSTGEKLKVHINKRMIYLAFYLVATELMQVLSGVCQTLRCQRPEAAEEKTNKIWMAEVWDGARFDKAVGHHSPNNPEKQ